MKGGHFLVVLLSLVSICTSTVSASKKVVVKIGARNPLSGKLAAHGIEIDEGIQVAVDEFNKANGDILEVKLLRRDDHSRPDAAINQAKQLIVKDGVVALTGGYVDSLVGAIGAVARKHRVPYVASASLQRRLTLNPSIYFSRISNMDGITNPVIEFITKKIHPKRLAIIHASTPGATEFSKIIKNRLEKAGIHIPFYEKVRPGTPDFSSFLLKCKNEQIDFVVAAIFYADHLVLVRQIRDMEVPIHGYLGPWGIAYSSFLKQMQNKANGLFGLSAWLRTYAYPGSEKESEKFVKDYIKKFGRSPTTTSMHGYVAARVITEALKRLINSGRKIGAQGLAVTIRETDMTTPMGRVRFDKKGDPMYYSQMVVQIQNGDLVIVYPEDRATGTLKYPSF